MIVLLGDLDSKGGCLDSARKMYSVWKVVWIVPGVNLNSVRDISGHFKKDVRTLRTKCHDSVSLVSNVWVSEI